MDAALLIVLVGELTAPLKPHLAAALPTVFDEKTQIVREAPPGSDVVWVSSPSRDEVVLTLHIAKEAGDLRRELRFSPSDSLPARGRAVAFAIASMRGERRPQSVVDPSPAPAIVDVPPPPEEKPSHWLLSVRGFGALMLPDVSGQGGGLFEVQYLFPFHLSAGLSTSFSGGGNTVATWLQPALWATVSLRFDTGAWIPRISAGVGAVGTLARAVSDGASSTIWQPYFRAAADVTWRFAKPHGVILGVSGNFTPATMQIVSVISDNNGNPNGNGNGNGNGNVKTVSTTLGPVWLAVELGYSVDF